MTGRATRNADDGPPRNLSTSMEALPARLLTRDAAHWSLVLALIERTVGNASAAWSLSTLEADEVRDRLVDVLLENNMRRLSQLRDPAKLPAYLFSVARNKIRRVAKRRRASAPHSLEIADSVAIPNVRRQLERVTATGRSRATPTKIASMLLRFRDGATDYQFLVLWLLHVENASMRHIARLLGVSRQAVGKAHERAIAAITRERARHASRATTGTE